MKPAVLTKSWPVRRVRARASTRTKADLLAVEEPLELRVRGRSVAVIMRTPGHDADLAAGFLLTEGIVHSADDIYDILQCRDADVRANEGNVVEAVLPKSVRVDFDRLTRHVFSGSSCGLCGKATIAAVRQQFPKITRPLRVSAALLRSLPAQLAAAQPVFQATGGLHATALFEADGRLLVAREDVGRHNAMDKVLGHALRAGWLPLRRHVLLVSGRVSFELMQKALAAGVSVVAGISAPTSLAVEFARANNQTLAGFLRADRLNVYAGRLAPAG
ncbi:MAG: formate dehydrogenase accessory sulfurtransferase FdhD [Opitutae bacterium]|nr:formate dehydrogenase accessory sulfurtransferase FdhD [Opitutae bacterium]